jgi:hypothetical protein
VLIPAPSADTRWRCAQCGNLTRFDVVRVSRTREFWHQQLSGAPVVEETDVLDGQIESVACRWCAGGGSIELVTRPTGAELRATAGG